MSIFCFSGMIPGSGVLAEGLLYTKMARYTFKLRKLLLLVYGHKTRQLAERHKLFLPQYCVLLSVGVQASLLQPLATGSIWKFLLFKMHTDTKFRIGRCWCCQSLFSTTKLQATITQSGARKPAALHTLQKGKQLPSI